MNLWVRVRGGDALCPVRHCKQSRRFAKPSHQLHPHRKSLGLNRQRNRRMAAHVEGLRVLEHRAADGVWSPTAGSIVIVSAPSSGRGNRQRRQHERIGMSRADRSTSRRSFAQNARASTYAMAGICLPALEARADHRQVVAAARREIPRVPRGALGQHNIDVCLGDARAEGQFDVDDRDAALLEADRAPARTRSARPARSVNRNNRASGRV